MQPGMRHTTTLTITSDSEWLVGMRPALHTTGQGCLVVADSVEEAERLLAVAAPRMIVVHWNNEGLTYERLTSLLWANSTMPRPAPIVVVADDYSVEQATLLFQMGVDDYLCAAEHGDRMGAILNALVRTQPISRTAGRVACEAPQRAAYQSSASLTTVQAAVVSMA